MGSYLDRLNEQYEEIVTGIDGVLNRATEENRDVKDDEQKIIDRDKSRLEDLSKSIEHYTALEKQNAKVATLRSTVPARETSSTTATQREGDPYDIHREFPTVGHYVIAVHRAMTMRDPEAIAQLDRATAHQVLADNPGIVPRPILGPVVNNLDGLRPFINSITKKALPAGQFDRPVINQHVAVGKQTAEKALTDSQKLLLGKLPVVADTFAGHLNISRQDIKWTSPGILQIVFEDFANVYADATDNEACDDFVASVLATQPIATWDAAAVTAAIYGAAGTTLGNSNILPDTIWVSPDVWGDLGGLTTTGGAPLFPGMNPGGTQGSPNGLKLVVDKNFAANTMIQGASRYAEWYEDVDGLMQVGEPDVLGQLVGYAGYGAFLNVKPNAFVKFTVPAGTTAGARKTAEKKS